MASVRVTRNGKHIIGDTTDAAFPGNAIIGKKDGVALNAGEVGEKITWTTPPTDQTATTTEADWTNAVLPLTSGVWLVQASVMGLITTASAANANAALQIKITDTSNVVVQQMDKSMYAGTLSTVTGVSMIGNVNFSFVANVSTSTSYKIRIKKTEAGGTATVQVYNSSTEFSQFFAIRIA